LQNAVYLGLNFVAMQTVQASLAAIIASTMPLLVGFAAWIFLGERLRPLGIAGLIAGVIGVIIIMSARMGGGVDLMGVLLCGIGVLALTVATLMVRGATSGGNFVMIVGLQMLVGCAVLIVATMLFETPRLVPSWPLFFAFSYTCLVPGLAATMIWFWLVNRLGATRAATFHFLNPFFGVAIASLLLSEPLGTSDILGVLIVTLGILAVQISRQKQARVS
jgi:drug/metabolite transporter (DMT)-like permease